MNNPARIAKITYLQLRTNYKNRFVMIIWDYFDKTGQNMPKKAQKLTKIDQKLPKFG